MRQKNLSPKKTRQIQMGSCLIGVVEELVAEGDEKVDDDAVGPSETRLDLVLAATARGSGVVDIVLAGERGKGIGGTQIWVH